MVELKSRLPHFGVVKMLLQRSKLNGEVFRELETRRTLRFELSGKSHFL